MNLSALLCANRGDISTWTAEIMDCVLAEGDSTLLMLFVEDFTIFIIQQKLFAFQLLTTEKSLM